MLRCWNSHLNLSLMYVVTHDLVSLTFVLANQDLSFFENTVGPDQLASDIAI